MARTKLSLKVTTTIDLTMSIVGALMLFSSKIKPLMDFVKEKTMMMNITQVVMGVALVGRMVPSSMLLDIALIEGVT